MGTNDNKNIIEAIMNDDSLMSLLISLVEEISEIDLSIEVTKMILEDPKNLDAFLKGGPGSGPHGGGGKKDPLIEAHRRGVARQNHMKSIERR